ncbi:hypothetical protein [Vibrio phage VP4B]|uniref:Uncharacterized protein n=1 Tax=Vibrio phage VP4B TaxID=1262540 RepID=V9LZ87_9CAUD|nr:virion structural protein [Vibrio phage VP4B]AGB07134.1 hypothetical protein [Vibrio phage VP4B]
MQHRDASVYERTPDFIQALVNVSTGTAPLTPDNLVSEVPAATEAGSDHGLMQQQAIEHIANGVRNAFQQIRQYIRPLDSAITEGVQDFYSPTSAITAVHNNFYISYVELENPFFVSPLFPETVPSKVWDYQNFEVRHLTEHANKFPRMELNQIEDLLHTTSEELSHFLDVEVAQSAYNYYVAAGEWAGLFPAKEKHLVLDRDADLPTLIQLYIVLSRLDVEETVLEGVQDMTLDAYRAYIKTALNVVIYALQRNRQYCGDLAKQILPIIKEEIGATRAEYGTVSGSIRVGLTERAIELVEENNTSLSEVLIGYAVARASNKDANHVPPLDAIPEYLEKYNEYLNGVKAEIISKAVKHVTRVAETKINEFQKQHEELGDIIAKFNDDLPYRRLSTAVANEISTWAHRYRDQVINGDKEDKVFLSHPTIAIAVAKKLGMTFAAEILSRSVVTSDMTLEQRRDKLAEAVGECVAGLCLGKNL